MKNVIQINNIDINSIEFAFTNSLRDGSIPLLIFIEMVNIIKDYDDDYIVYSPFNYILDDLKNNGHQYIDYKDNLNVLKNKHNIYKQYSITIKDIKNYLKNAHLYISTNTNYTIDRLASIYHIFQLVISVFCEDISKKYLKLQLKFKEWFLNSLFYLGLKNVVNKYFTKINSVKKKISKIINNTIEALEYLFELSNYKGYTHVIKNFLRFTYYNLKVADNYDFTIIDNIYRRKYNDDIENSLYNIEDSLIMLEKSNNKFIIFNKQVVSLSLLRYLRDKKDKQFVYYYNDNIQSIIKTSFQPLKQDIIETEVQITGTESVDVIFEQLLDIFKMSVNSNIYHVYVTFFKNTQEFLFDTFIKYLKDEYVIYGNITLKDIFEYKNLSRQINNELYHLLLDFKDISKNAKRLLENFNKKTFKIVETCYNNNNFDDIINHIPQTFFHMNIDRIIYNFEKRKEEDLSKYSKLFAYLASINREKMEKSILMTYLI